MNNKLSGGLPIKTGHLFIIGAILMAIITAVLFTNIMGSQKAEKKAPEVKTQEIVVTTDFVPAGAEVETKHVAKVAWPSKFISKGSHFDKVGDVVGRRAKTDLYSGEIVYKQKLFGDDSGGGLEVLIPQGMRAVSISINEVSSVAGFIKPGDHVDVLGTIQTEAEDGMRKGFTTKTILQDVVVLAVAQEMVNRSEPRMRTPDGVKEGALGKEEGEDEKDKKKKSSDRKKSGKKAKASKTVTLALTPEQSEIIALGEEAADFHLALRRPDDQTVNLVTGATMGQLLSGTKSSGPSLDMEPFPMPIVPTSSGTGVELIQGTEKTMVDFGGRSEL